MNRQQAVCLASAFCSVGATANIIPGTEPGDFSVVVVNGLETTPRMRVSMFSCVTSDDYEAAMDGLRWPHRAKRVMTRDGEMWM